jgi:hypothetical protein
MGSKIAHLVGIVFFSSLFALADRLSALRPSRPSACSSDRDRAPTRTHSGGSCRLLANRKGLTERSFRRKSRELPARPESTAFVFLIRRLQVRVLSGVLLAEQRDGALNNGSVWHSTAAPQPQPRHSVTETAVASYIALSPTCTARWAVICRYRSRNSPPRKNSGEYAKRWAGRNPGFETQ